MDDGFLVFSMDTNSAISNSETSPTKLLTSRYKYDDAQFYSVSTPCTWHAMLVTTQRLHVHSMKYAALSRIQDYQSSCHNIFFFCFAF